MEVVREPCRGKSEITGRMRGGCDQPHIACMYSLGWPQIHYVAEVRFELLILLPLPTRNIGTHHHARPQMQLLNCLLSHSTLEIGLMKNAL